jgi:hypothetical protein
MQKAVVHYPLCESSGYVKQAKAGKPPQIKSVSLILRRFQEYHSPKFGRIIPTASYSET